MFNMAWHDVYAELEPEYAELSGYYDAAAKSSGKKPNTRAKKKKK